MNGCFARQPKFHARQSHPMSSKFWILPILAFDLISGVAFAAPGAGFIRNGGFEAGLDDWRPLFTREPLTGRVTVERQDVHSGQGAARIEHTGQKDWGFDSAERLAAAAGDVFELQAWL